MLRIKQEKWEEFQKNHTKFGFRKAKNHDYYFKNVLVVEDIYKDFAPKIIAFVYGESCLYPRNVEISLEGASRTDIQSDVLDNELEIIYVLHDFLEIY